MFNLSDKPSIASQYLADLRNIDSQNDRLRFRKNLERLGEILAYEISKTLDYSSVQIHTPLAMTDVSIPKQTPVIIAVLRASIPFYQGFLNFFDRSESGFIGAFREEGENITINLGYHALPDLDGKPVILADPMLATGKSFVRSIETLLDYGTPAVLHIAAAIAAPEGVDYLKQHLKIPYKLWLGAMDSHLNAQAYIVPGLGDAGDLAFGEKL